MSKLVLVIDDSESDQIAYCRALRDTDWVVKTVFTLADGAAAFRQEKPDVILLDYNLPDGDGVSFLRNLVQAENGTCPPIIMMTGSGDEHVAVEAIKSGASDYFVKDIAGSHLKLLSWAIQRVLAEHTQRLERIKNEQRLRLAANVYNNITEGILVADPDGTIVSVNAAHCHMSGYSEAELLGRNPRLVKSDRHTPAFFENMWHCIREDGYWQGEIWNRRKNGSLYLCKETITAIRDERGILQQYVSVSSDITEASLAQKNLKQQTQLLEDVVNAVPYGLVVYDEKRFLKFHNQSFIDILKLPVDLLTKAHGTFPDLVAYLYARGDYGRQQTLAEVESRFIGVMERHERLTLERQQSDGSFIEMRGVPLSTGWTVMTYLDTTVRRKEQIELQDWQKRVQLANQSAGVGIWDMNLQTGHVSWDDQIFKLLGFPVHSVTPSYELWVNGLHPDDRARVVADFKRCIETGADYHSDYKIIWSDGSLHYIRAVGHCQRDATGKVVRVIGTNIDFTAVRTAAQDLAVALEQAEEASVSKGLFLANMSHEIRTPLAAILGLLTVLSQTPLTAHQFDYIDKIEGAAKSLLGLLNDILDFSKIDAGRLDLEPQPFKLDQFLRDLAVVLSAYVGNKPIDVLYDIDSTLPKNVISDPLRLKQILVNLGGNAIKFTASGQVVISVRAVRNAQDSADVDRVSFTVRDSGIGIAKENMERLFSSFTQAETSTTRRFGGTGLGLAISKRLIELMGGTISVESEMGIGTTFQFELPFQRDLTGVAEGGAGQSPEQGAPSDNVSVAHKVLLIDDNPLAAALMSSTMRSFGWSVDVAASGSQAIAMVQAQIDAAATPYGFIYLDWQLPDIDGWETLAQVCRMLPMANGARPKFIMISANGRDNLALRTQEEQNQLSDFLVKPVTPSMLFNASLKTPTDVSSMRRTQRASHRALTGLHILVVEDNAINQQVAEELLSNQGALVSIASNGQEGVKAIASANPAYDLVLMDIQMPVMDGYSATEYVRRELKIENLPIIGLTANALSSDREKCLQAGMDAHIGKPFDLEQLVSMILRLTGAASARPARPSADWSHAPTPEIGGPADLDLPGALRRLGGLQSLYMRSAQDLINVLPGYLHKLELATQENDAPGCVVALHTMKGTTATLGLNKLSRTVAALESEFKKDFNTQELRSQLAALTSVVQEGVSALKQAIVHLAASAAVTPTHDTTPTVNDAVRAALNGLVPLLKAQDLGVLDAFSQLRSTLLGLPAKTFSALESDIQNLNLNAALALCLDLESR